MQAAVYRAYGSPDRIHLEDVPTPVPGDDDVLVRVRAASLNALDSHFMRGTWLMRPMTGFTKPRPTTPGVDVAGEVEAVGRNVTRFSPGDAVFGTAKSSCAEFACTPQGRLTPKPASLSFEQAAAIPLAALTALQGLRDKAKVQPGQKVLINGASGGVGTFAVQIVRVLGADVTAVCGTRHVEVARSLGASRVIDYSREDFTRSADRYDVVFDVAGSRSVWACRRVMTPKGIFLPVGVRPGNRVVGPLPHLLMLLLTKPLVSQRIVFWIAKSTPEDLALLAEMADSNQITPAVDRVFPLTEVAAAMRYFKEGHPLGKVVIRA